jgi:hypothetical protein
MAERSLASEVYDALMARANRAEADAAAARRPPLASPYPEESLQVALARMAPRLEDHRDGCPCSACETFLRGSRLFFLRLSRCLAP